MPDSIENNAEGDLQECDRHDVESATKLEPIDDVPICDAPAVKNEPTVDGTDGDGPPSKRRKLVNGSLPRVPLRAVSPPWKKVAVEGPTSFLDEGKRRSARTNLVPLELQAPSGKRQTRAANHQAASHIKSRYRSAQDTLQSSPLTSKPTPKRQYRKSTGAISKTTSFKSTRSPRATRLHRPAISSSPTQNRHSRRISTTKSEQSSPPVPTPFTPKRRPGRPRKHFPAPEKPAEVNRRTEAEEVPHSDGNTEDDDSDNAEQESEDEDEDEFELDPNITPQRLNLKVKLPELVPQHPLNIPNKRRHETFRQWIEKDDPIEGPHPRLSDDQVRREARARLRILKASEPGGALGGVTSTDIPEGEEEPPRQYFHFDHLLAHALDMQRRMEREKARHMRWAKKIGQAVIDYWKELQPKTEEDLRREKDELTEATALAVKRQCIVDLALKWDLLRAEVARQRQIRWEQEQEILEKEALNKVLEQSTQLLDARKRRNSTASGHLGTSDEGSGTESPEGDDRSSIGSDDESNMSIGSSDQEDEIDDAMSDDQNLSPEKLRRKYHALLQDEPSPANDVANPGETADASVLSAANPSPPNIDVPTDTIQDEGNERSTLNAEKASKSPVPNLLEDNNPIFDETDESIDMDDDMGETDDDSDEQSHDEDGGSSEADSDGGPGLLGLFSKQELAEAGMPQDAADSAPEESYSLDTTHHKSNDHIMDDAASIPDASQVQTPSASNSEAPSVGVHKETEQNQKRFSTLREVSPEQNNNSDLQQPSEAQVMDLDEASLPATPASSKPLKTAVPSLLRGTLREYQHFGLDWLAGLYANGTNGILADEMGLGKTIQTISLLAHLAVEHEVWGPHLIVVPTSVMLNWEMEFKKFLPGFKVMTYYGTQDERKQKRKGWLDDDKWNVVISSYQLVLQDQISFKKRGWHYLVLDEAHNIKNFRSQRWQTLLTFRTAARLLLTGTPLQNNLTELWSLMFFLMPSDSTESGIAGFADLQSFTNWFKKPVDQILEQGRDTMDAEAQELVRRLHEVLRPYLLRRLKADVEKQMPAKYEHVVYCKLSKRQRYLYDGFMSRASTRETLASGNYLSIINCLMQLRKVCNHPDLFETRPIVTSFAMSRSAIADYEIKELLVRRKLLNDYDDQRVSLDVVDLLPGSNGPISALDTIQPSRLGGIAKMRQVVARHSGYIVNNMTYDGSSTQSTRTWMENQQRIAARDNLHHRVYLTSLRSQRRPLMSHSLVDLLRIDLKPTSIRPQPHQRSQLLGWLSEQSPAMNDLVVDLPRRFNLFRSTIEKYSFVTPAVIAPDMTTLALSTRGKGTIRGVMESFPEDHFHESRMRLSIAFPDKRLLQYDCGKLQRLDTLLRTLQAGGHRALIFTQMTKVLDILEQFLNIHGYRYLRLDGSTKIEQRQILTDRFNNDPKILVFILSSRSGGLGINLTGADTVIFYDLDWNPAMDKQCQDRCHRIGQTRDVHIYRFVSEYTIEANILRKANQKRLLDDVIIQEGDFTTDFFHRPNPRDAFADDAMHEADAEASAAMDRILGAGAGNEKLSTRILEQAEDKEDVQAAKVAEKEVQHADEADFSERPGAIITKTAATPLNSIAGIGSGAPLTPKPLATADFDAPEFLRGAVQPRTEMAVDIFAEKAPIGVDLHIVEHLEWELRNVPLGPPVGHEKSKKKARDPHKVTRKR